MKMNHHKILDKCLLIQFFPGQLWPKYIKSNYHKTLERKWDQANTRGVDSGQGVNFSSLFCFCAKKSVPCGLAKPQQKTRPETTVTGNWGGEAQTRLRTLPKSLPFHQGCAEEAQGKAKDLRPHSLQKGPVKQIEWHSPEERNRI